ncbi:hypothetical protein MRB53_028237 [Persea americana]|uniref:Uncharacterized protein n=1 Tax=Persea americana TaxID=3435 RepID=A0ACC2KFM3_PERAE|nr:hypothetical protein MRB53_028237 [Persea americana]
MKQSRDGGGARVDEAEEGWSWRPTRRILYIRSLTRPTPSLPWLDLIRTPRKHHHSESSSSSSASSLLKLLVLLCHLFSIVYF